MANSSNYYGSGVVVVAPLTNAAKTDLDTYKFFCDMPLFLLKEILDVCVLTRRAIKTNKDIPSFVTKKTVADVDKYYMTKLSNRANTYYEAITDGRIKKRVSTLITKLSQIDLLSRQQMDSVADLIELVTETPVGKALSENLYTTKNPKIWVDYSVVLEKILTDPNYHFKNSKEEEDLLALASELYKKAHASDITH